MTVCMKIVATESDGGSDVWKSQHKVRFAC